MLKMINAKFASQKFPRFLSSSLTTAAILADVKFLAFARKSALKPLKNSKRNVAVPSKITAPNLNRRSLRATLSQLKSAKPRATASEEFSRFLSTQLEKKLGLF